MPETVITNDHEAARAFLASQPATIIKPQCSPLVVGEGSEAFLATRVHGSEGLEAELATLRWAPAIFQRAVDAIADLRVTIVGEQAFAARLDVDPAGIGRARVRDWRHRDYVRGPHFRAEAGLPEEVRGGCLAVTRALGLEFAAIDLVVDRAGDVWFLELNPNGQWGFIEIEAGLPIAAALAERLQGR